MRIKLTHHCGLEGARGYIGDIIECDDEVGQKILDIKGGILLSAAPAPIETAEAEPAPEVAVAEAPAKRGPGRPPKKKE